MYTPSIQWERIKRWKALHRRTAPKALLLSCEAANTTLKRQIPDWTRSAIRVTCCHLANHRVQSSIFMNFKEVSWWREDWGLISILHNNFDCCCILKGSSATETWVDVDIGCLHLQCIGFFGLEVQRLLKKWQRWMLLSKP